MRRPLVAEEIRRARGFARRVGRSSPCAPLPPASLPPGRVVEIPGRGEVFLREQPAAPGSPVLVLLHGWTASADLNWFQAFEAISGLGHVIAVDHRGHGRGMRSEETFTLEAAADDVAGLLRHLGLGPAVLVGYSMGGPIAKLTWQRHPDVVRGLVLQATALEWRARRRERIIWRLMGLIELSLRIGTPRSLLERTFRDAVERCPELEPLVPWMKAELRRGDPAALADAGRALGCYDGRPFASAIDVPTTVVVTTADRLVKPKKQYALVRSIPGARVVALDGDHDACVVKPGEFRAATCEAIVDVLQRGDSVAPRATAQRHSA